jgi:hypothetical protein
MRTTSSIAAPHREHASPPPRLLLDRFDTIPTPCVTALLSCDSPLLPTHDARVGCGAMTSGRRRVPTARSSQRLNGASGSPNWSAPLRTPCRSRGRRTAGRPPSPPNCLEIYPPSPHISTGGSLSASQVGDCADCGKAPQDQGRDSTVDYRRTSYLCGMRAGLGHCCGPSGRRHEYRHVDGIPLPSRSVECLCL